MRLKILIAVFVLLVFFSFWIKTMPQYSIYKIFMNQTIRSDVPSEFVSGECIANRDFFKQNNVENLAALIMTLGGEEAREKQKCENYIKDNELIYDLYSEFRKSPVPAYEIVKFITLGKRKTERCPETLYLSCDIENAVNARCTLTCYEYELYFDFKKYKTKWILDTLEEGGL